MSTVIRVGLLGAAALALAPASAAAQGNQDREYARQACRDRIQSDGYAVESMDRPRVVRGEAIEIPTDVRDRRGQGFRVTCRMTLADRRVEIVGQETGYAPAPPSYPQPEAPGRSRAPTTAAAPNAQQGYGTPAARERARATERCVQLATESGFSNARVNTTREGGNGRYELTLTAWHGAQTGTLGCRYDARNDAPTLFDVGNGFFSSTHQAAGAPLPSGREATPPSPPLPGGASPTARAAQGCTRMAGSAGFTQLAVRSTRDIGRGWWDVRLGGVRRDGKRGELGCRYNVENGAGNLYDTGNTF